MKMRCLWKWDGNQEARARTVAKGSLRPSRSASCLTGRDIVFAVNNFGSGEPGRRDRGILTSWIYSVYSDQDLLSIQPLVFRKRLMGGFRHHYSILYWLCQCQVGFPYSDVEYLIPKKVQAWRFLCDFCWSNSVLVAVQASADIQNRCRSQGAFDTMPQQWNVKMIIEDSLDRTFQRKRQRQQQFGWLTIFFGDKVSKPDLTIKGADKRSEKTEAELIVKESCAP